MIDLHAHIIPGFDDGAQTIEDALDMARTAVGSGVRIMTATSHADFSSLDPQIMIQEYRRGLSALRSAIGRARLPLRIASGMELLVNESLLHYAENHPLPSLNGSGYLLVEFYFDIGYGEALRRLEVLRKMRLPALLIELMMLIYRFIFLLLETASAIMTAQESRLGNRDYRTKVRSFGAMASALFVQSMRRSDALYDALESRCYDGTIRVLSQERPAKKKEIVGIALFESLLLLITIWSIIE